MSLLIGDRMPAPLRFEFGVLSVAGGAARAVLLGSLDEDGSVRFCVLSTAEIEAPDDRRLRIALAKDSATRGNLTQRGAASLWCVLDGAAYTVKGRAKQSAAADDPERHSFEIEVESVWRDFRPDAPMIAGPTYRVPAED